jgi:hypothetical protein
MSHKIVGWDNESLGQGTYQQCENIARDYILAYAEDDSVVLVRAMPDDSTIVLSADTEVTAHITKQLLGAIL